MNVFYVVTGLWGWWVWLFGGERRTEKPIEHVGLREGLTVGLVGLLLTAAMWHGGILIEDAAPFMDALTPG